MKSKCPPVPNGAFGIQSPINSEGVALCRMSYDIDVNLWSQCLPALFFHKEGDVNTRYSSPLNMCEALAVAICTTFNNSITKPLATFHSYDVGDECCRKEMWEARLEYRSLLKSGFRTEVLAMQWALDNGYRIV